jgi:hypothetical protein
MHHYEVRPPTHYSEFSPARRQLFREEAAASQMARENFRSSNGSPLRPEGEQIDSKTKKDDGK